VDHIRIAVSAGPSQSQEETLARLIQALDRVAAANALTREKSKEADATTGHFEYRAETSRRTWWR